MIRVFAVAVGYCFGLFQTAYLLGLSVGIDIRNTGSGNSGTTNALRTMGKKAGLIVFACDFLKALLAYLAGAYLIGRLAPGLEAVLGIYAAFGAVLGHCFPLYMGFKGGKGIACMAGFMAAFSWQCFLICFVVFAVVFLTTHYVSLGSLLGTASVLVTTIIFGQLGLLKKIPNERLIETYVLIAAFVALAWFLHRENIKRLAGGTERKTYLGKTKS